MLSRRNILRRISALPLLGGLLGSGIPIQSVLAAPAAAAKRNLIKELGLRTFINAAGTYTPMTASLMPDEVMGRENNIIDLTVFMLKSGQEKIVAKRIQEE